MLYELSHASTALLSCTVQVAYRYTPVPAPAYAGFRIRFEVEAHCNETIPAIFAHRPLRRAAEFCALPGTHLMLCYSHALLAVLRDLRG